MTCPGQQLDMGGSTAQKERPEDMAAQRAARRFVMMMPAGNAAHLEARVAFGLRKPCYAVGPVAKAETRYRFFDRIAVTYWSMCPSLMR
jgi:hypothetical protein